VGDFKQAKWNEPPLFELGHEGRTGFKLPEIEEEAKREVGKLLLTILNHILRDRPPEIPELSEVEVVRHFVRLSQMNYGVDLGPQPLGSCTMKYNPKLIEELAWDRRITGLHPLKDPKLVQGVLKMLYELGRWLCKIVGLNKVTFQPAAGAHGELTGALIIRALHRDRGEGWRDEMIISVSAHGTNFASASMAGFKVIRIPTDEEGRVDLKALKAAISPRTAGMMLINLNTLGIFESKIRKIAKIIHEVGEIMYYDGANLNGILGIARPGDMGFDIVHLNIYKTLLAPHGGGDPGACALCVSKELVDFLPTPVIEYDSNKKLYNLNYKVPKSIGRVRTFYGNVIPLLKAYIYLLSLGYRGLRRVAEIAALNTNYFLAKVKRIRGFEAPYGTNLPRKHEIVISVKKLKEETGLTAEDVAKYLLDKGPYAPTIYFPPIVEEALMFEFTETETKENIDNYLKASMEISGLAYSNPKSVKSSPHDTSVSRLDLVKANKLSALAPTYFRYREVSVGRGERRK